VKKKRARRTRPRKAAKTASVSKTKIREKVKERMVLPPLGEPPFIRPSYHRYLRAHVSLVEQGKGPTLVNLAKELGISGTAVWKFQKRHPDVLAWIGAFIAKGHEHYTALVVRRVGNLAIQGSAQHADIFLKFQSGAYVRAGAPGDPDAPLSDGRIVVTHNYLIPRPDYAQIPVAVVSSTPALLPACLPPGQVEKKKIPVVSVR
jgi:hypothetical protein